MRSLPMLLTLALALTSTLTACDKKEGDNKEGDKKEATDKKDEGKEGEKAEAKKTDDQEAAANTVDPEAGCIHDKPETEGHDCGHAAQPGESTGHFGAAFAVADSQPLSTVLASGVPTTPVKVTGTVGKVCQKMGCWMVINDGDKSARVLVKDHAFAIPMDGEGKAAVVEGTVEVKELSEANVAHLKQDGDSSLEGEGPRQEYFLHATAVELAPVS